MPDIPFQMEVGGQNSGGSFIPSIWSPQGTHDTGSTFMINTGMLDSTGGAISNINNSGVISNGFNPDSMWMGSPGNSSIPTIHNEGPSANAIQFRQQNKNNNMNVPGLSSSISNVNQGTANPDASSNGSLLQNFNNQYGNIAGNTNSTTGAPNTSGANPNFVTGLNIGSISGNAQGLNQPAVNQHLLDSLNKTYGSGVGDLLYGFLVNGAGYNPAVAQALIAQMAPVEASAEARLMNYFGATGTSFSSSAALGLADLQSQFISNADAVLAQQYQQSVQNFMSVLTGTMPGAQANKAGQLGFGDIAQLISSIVGVIPTH